MNKYFIVLISYLQSFDLTFVKCTLIWSRLMTLVTRKFIWCNIMYIISGFHVESVWFHLLRFFRFEASLTCIKLFNILRKFIWRIASTDLEVVTCLATTKFCIKQFMRITTRTTIKDSTPRMGSYDISNKKNYFMQHYIFLSHRNSYLISFLKNLSFEMSLMGIKLFNILRKLYRGTTKTRSDQTTKWSFI